MFGGILSHFQTDGSEQGLFYSLFSLREAFLYLKVELFFLAFAGILVCPQLLGLSPVGCEKGNGRNIEKDELEK